MGCSANKGAAPPVAPPPPQPKKEEAAQKPNEEPKSDKPVEAKKEETAGEKEEPGRMMRAGDIVTVSEGAGIDGTVLRITTTDVLVKTDKEETWYAIEDVVRTKAGLPLPFVGVGDEVTTVDRCSGKIVQRDTCTFVVRTEEGEEKTVDLENIVVVKVEVVQANDLRNADIVTKSDPYVTCEIVGRPGQAKSYYVQDNLNPVWNFEADLVGFREGDALKFDIFDFDMSIKKDDFLGTATLECKDFLEKGFYGPLLLTGKRAQGTLTVRVTVDPKPREEKPVEDTPQKRPEPQVEEVKQHPTGWCC